MWERKSMIYETGKVLQFAQAFLNFRKTAKCKKSTWQNVGSHEVKWVLQWDLHSNLWPPRANQRPLYPKCVHQESTYYKSEMCLWLWLFSPCPTVLQVISTPTWTSTQSQTAVQGHGGVDQVTEGHQCCGEMKSWPPPLQHKHRSKFRKPNPSLSFGS